MSPAEEIQLEIQRRLSGARRLEIAAAMSASARDLLLTRLQLAHPDWGPRQLVHEWIRVVHRVDPASPSTLRP